MEISRQLYRGTKSSASCTCYMQKEIMPIAELESRFYIRLTAKDRPGVLAAIASVFGNSEVSIATVLQKTSGEDFAQLVLVTHYVREADVRDALAVLKGMNIVAEICTVVRVEGEL